MYIQPEDVPQRRSILQPILPRQNDAEQDNQDREGGSNTVMIAIAVVVVVLLTVVLVTYSYLRRLRAKGDAPKFIPGSFLKRKWESWKPRSKYSQINRGNSTDLTSQNTAYNGSNGVETEERAASAAAAAGIDRNTSIRSVMTLPAYSQAPKESEQVLGREGEREGMDTVVEFPETQDEEENRREDQMESLYQIRVARRREIAEREERRRQRHEARARGDTARLEELRREARERASASNEALNGGLSASAATLIAEHQSRGRDRRVSSVAYADIGQVRHDGTRIRANSNDSERGGLLDGAAPMGEAGDSSSLRPRGSSESRSLTHPHFRNRSASSALSISTNASDIDQPPAFTPAPSERPRTSGSNNTSTSESSPIATRFTPEDSTGSDDIGESRIPINVVPTDEHQEQDQSNRHSRPPPEYEQLEWGDAPAYEQAVRRARSNASQRGVTQTTATGPTGAPQLPELNLPSISVQGASEPNTPVEGRGTQQR